MRIRLLLRVRSPLANPPSTAGSIPSYQSKCAGVDSNSGFTRDLGTSRLLLLALWEAFYAGPSSVKPRPLGYVHRWMRRETSYASVERHRVRCLLSGVHGAVRGAVYADLSGTGMVREAFYAGPSPEVGPSVRREKLPPRKPCIPSKFGEGVEPIGSNSSINWEGIEPIGSNPSINWEGIEPIGSNSSTNLGGM